MEEESSSFVSGGCEWKRLGDEERAAVVLFHGSCKKKAGLVAILRFYDRHGMLRVQSLRAAATADKSVTPPMASSVLAAINDRLEDAARDCQSFQQFLTAVQRS
jgi:hypothetical protein